VLRGGVPAARPRKVTLSPDVSIVRDVEKEMETDASAGGGLTSASTPSTREPTATLVSFSSIAHLRHQESRHDRDRRKDMAALPTSPSTSSASPAARDEYRKTETNVGSDKERSPSTPPDVKPFMLVRWER
jgi:hypothetical protein